jgi:hypothetical protein
LFWFSVLLLLPSTDNSNFPAAEETFSIEAVRNKAPSSLQDEVQEDALLQSTTNLGEEAFGCLGELAEPSMKQPRFKGLVPAVE